MTPIPFAFVALLAGLPAQLESLSEPPAMPVWRSLTAVPRKGPDAGNPVQPNSIPLGSHEDILILTKGVFQTGKWTGCAASGALQWTASSGEAREVPLAQVRGVIRPTRPALPQIPLPDALVLRNGDWLPVRVVSLADQKVTVNTANAGEWAISRGEISALHLRSNSAPVIIDGAQDWRRWLAQAPVAVPSIIATYLDGAYTVSFAKNAEVRAFNFQRDVGFLPPSLEIKLTISTTHTTPSYQFRVPGFTIQPVAEGIRVVYSQPMTRPGARGRGMISGRAVFNWPEGFDHTSRAHAYQLFVDRTSRNLLIYVNGRRVGSIDGKAELGPITESVITLMLNGFPGAKVTVSNFWVAPWGLDFPALNPDALEQILLGNGDVAHGTLQDVNEKSVAFQFEGDALEVPRERIKFIRFPVETVAPKGARFRFKGGGCLSVSKWRVEQDKVIATIEAGGNEVRFPLEAISEFSNALSVSLPGGR